MRETVVLRIVEIKSRVLAVFWLGGLMLTVWGFHGAISWWLLSPPNSQNHKKAYIYLPKFSKLQKAINTTYGLYNILPTTYLLSSIYA